MKKIFLLLITAALTVQTVDAGLVTCVKVDDNVLICTDDDGNDTTVITFDE